MYVYDMISMYICGIIYTVWCMFIAIYIVGVFNTQLTHSRDLCEIPTVQLCPCSIQSMAHPPVSHAKMSFPPTPLFIWAQWISEGTEPHGNRVLTLRNPLFIVYLSTDLRAQRSRTAVGADAILKTQKGKEWLARTHFQRVAALSLLEAHTLQRFA